jgi:hypothetical protein
LRAWINHHRRMVGLQQPGHVGAWLLLPLQT